MNTQLIDDLRYPIGRPQVETALSQERIRALIDEIAAAPAALRAAVEGLSAEQLDTPYRPGGWTVRQVVHHLPDSHLNSYIRFRLALTEDEPTVTDYSEAAWAELPDAKSGDVEISLLLLEALHQRWVPLLRSLGPDDLRRTFVHPATGLQTLERNLQIYAWHGRHHVAHIMALRERME